MICVAGVDFVVWTTKHTENVMSRVHEARETLRLAERYMGELAPAVS